MTYTANSKNPTKSEKRGISSSAERSVHIGEATGAAPVSPTIIAKFWSRVEVRTSRVCWLWRGMKNQSGYGRFRPTWNDPEVKAHRFAWQIVNGPVPDGKLIIHSCDTPACCNPKHLRVGSYQDNSDDCVTRGRQSRLLGTANPRTKLTDDQVAAIRRDPRPGVQVARDYGVCDSLISMIRKGQRRRFTP